jgi:hypothetical protein
MTHKAVAVTAGVTAGDAAETKNEQGLLLVL